MKGLVCQMKSVGRDRFCILSFLLPVVVALALNVTGSIDFSSLGEYYFCVVDGEVTDEVQEWLWGYGDVMVCQTREEWISAIREPSTNLIGVEMDKKGVRTIVSGDELPLCSRQQPHFQLSMNRGGRQQRSAYRFWISLMCWQGSSIFLWR